MDTSYPWIITRPLRNSWYSKYSEFQEDQWERERERQSGRQWESALFIERFCLNYDGNFLFMVSVVFFSILFILAHITFVYTTHTHTHTLRKWERQNGINSSWLISYNSDERPCPYGQGPGPGPGVLLLVSFILCIWRDQSVNHFSVIITTQHVRENKCKLVSSDYDAAAAAAHTLWPIKTKQVVS